MGEWEWEGGTWQGVGGKAEEAVGEWERGGGDGGGGEREPGEAAKDPETGVSAGKLIKIRIFVKLIKINTTIIIKIVTSKIIML